MKYVKGAATVRKLIVELYLLMLFLWYKLKWLMDWKTLIIFIITTIIMSSEVWGAYLLAVLTDNPWWAAIGSACWLFWLGPGTPFIPLCLTISIFVKRVLTKYTK